MQRKSIRFYLEQSLANILYGLFWALGGLMGVWGYTGFFPTLLDNPLSLSSILVGVIELPASIYLFMLMRRQAFPSGIIKALASAQEETFAKRTRDFPVLFALGVLAGLAGNALVIFISDIILLSS
jgi:hypothetical protein